MSGQKKRATGIYTEAARTLLAKQECPDALVKASFKSGLSSSNQQESFLIRVPVSVKAWTRRPKFQI